MPYTEHEKLKGAEVRGKAIREFLGWAKEHNMSLCFKTDIGSREEYIPVTQSVDSMLTEHLEIDLAKLEAESVSLLAEVGKRKKQQ